MQISVEQFKTKYIKLMDEVQKYHREIVITKLGKPIAKLVPILDKSKKETLFGYMKDSVSIHGDIVESTGEKWDAE